MRTDDKVRTVELLAPSANSWTELGELKYPRHGRPVVASFGDGRLLVTGGVHLGIRKSFKNVEELVQDRRGNYSWKVRVVMYSTHIK